MINKIIFQTWKTKDIPQELSLYAESIKYYNSDFEYHLFTDEDNRNFIIKHYPWFLETFDSYKHNIERADAIRYFLLYTYGGVYIDLDMECLKPLDSLLRNGELFFSIEAGPSTANQVISNAFMAATKGNPFFHHIIKNLTNFKKRDIVYQDVFDNTGPNMVTREYRRYRDKFRFNIIGLDYICPIRVIHQHPLFRGNTLDEIREQNKLYLIHHCMNSWNIQLKCPEVAIDGYVLFKNHDINGYDIEYVEYGNQDYSKILARCDNNPDAIGFNYNGFIKGVGGKLEKITIGDNWFGEGIIPWIYIKKDKVPLVA